MQENKIHWQEGMLLKPHHFQQSEMYYESLFQKLLIAFKPYYWGLIDIDLDQESLEYGKVIINRAKGFFQDGSYFSYNSQVQNSLIYEVSSNSRIHELFLALPIKATRDGVKNQQRHTFSCKEVSDIYSTESALESIEVVNLDVKIVSNQSDRKDFHCIKFAEIEKVTEKNSIIVSNKFIPIFIETKNNPFYNTQIQLVLTIINEKIQILSRRLNTENPIGNDNFQDFVILQLLNRYKAIFHFISNRSSFHPEALFFQLLQFDHELATYTSEMRLLRENAVYQHANQYSCFSNVLDSIKLSLEKTIELTALEISVIEKKSGFWCANLPNDKNLDEFDYILSVDADLAKDLLIEFFMKQAKIADQSQIHILVNRQLPGLKIITLKKIPRQVPYQAGKVYFLLEINTQLWSNIKNNKEMIIHIGKPIQKLDIKIWAIKK